MKSCNDGYYYNERNGFCEKCSSKKLNCSKCKTDFIGKVICTNCYSPYQIYFEYCKKDCSLVEEQCSSCIDASTCTDCKTGYYLKSGANHPNKCQKCSTVKENCTACSESGGVVTCSRCSLPYQLVNKSCEKNCSLVEEQCSSCTDASICTSCNTGYYLKSEMNSGSLNLCTLCSETVANCSECSLVGSTVKCSVCNKPYKVESGSCEKDCSLVEEQCSTCTDASTCTACNTGYYLKAGATNPNQCQKCSEIYEHCLSCEYNSGELVCTDCGDNKTWYSEGKKCRTECDSTKQWKSSNDSCVACSTPTPHCKTCKFGTLTCQSCEDTYELTS